MRSLFDEPELILRTSKNVEHDQLPVIGAAHKIHPKNLLKRQGCIVIYCGCFMEAGASVNIRDDDGRTALDMTRVRYSRDRIANYPRTIELLMAAGD